MSEQEKQARKLMEVIESASDELDEYHSLTDGEHAWNPWPWFPELRDSLGSAKSSLELVFQKTADLR